MSNTKQYEKDNSCQEPEYEITERLLQEALKSDIFCLKRQLALIADENQLLKVKIRRLENELRRKDKYIERFQSAPQKDREVRRFVYDSGASIIYKLQKRNEQLEDMILERDLQNEKRYNDMKTMCLYSHIDSCKTNQRGSGTNVSRPNSGLGSNSFCHSSLNKIKTPNRFDSKKPNRMRSSSSLQSDSFGKSTMNRYSVSSTGDSTTFHRRAEADGESTKFIKILQSERIVDKRAIKSKNAEISRLLAELREIKSLLKRKNDDKITKSTSTTQLEETSQATRQSPASRDCPNFIEENKRNVSRARTKHFDRRSSRKTFQYTEVDCKADCKKLPTVDEQNEEISLANESCKMSDINNHKILAERAVSRPKTRIEYVFDSEVSSDGEEFCLPSNLRSFLQQAVNTMSSGAEGDTTSD